MTNSISIVKADPRSLAGSTLNLMALGEMAHSLAGSKEEKVINQTFSRLWRTRNNRFSHQYAYEAQIKGKTLGLVTCYPVHKMNRLAWPTFTQLLSFRKLGLVAYNLMHPKAFFSTVTLKEGQDDEFHIGTLAAIPESRGLGIGSRLIEFAESQARLRGFSKSSLTVKKENHRAFTLYRRLGYEITGEENKPTLSLYRMAKNLL